MITAAQDIYLHVAPRIYLTQVYYSIEKIRQSQKSDSIVITSTGADIGNRLAIGTDVINVGADGSNQESENPFSTEATMFIVPEEPSTTITRADGSAYGVRLDIIFTNNSSLNYQPIGFVFDCSNVLNSQPSKDSIKLECQGLISYSTDGWLIRADTSYSPTIEINNTYKVTITVNDYRKVKSECLCITVAKCVIPYDLTTRRIFGDENTILNYHKGEIRYITSPALSFDGTTCQRLIGGRFRYNFNIKNIWLNPITKIVLSPIATNIVIVGDPQGWTVAGNQLVYSATILSGATLRLTAEWIPLQINLPNNQINYAATSIIGCTYNGNNPLPACV